MVEFFMVIHETMYFVLLFKIFYSKYDDLPSGVLGELEVSSDPRLRESVLLKQDNAELRAAPPTATPTVSPDVAAAGPVTAAAAAVRKYFDVFVEV